ncbi:MAG TPA: gephyrin-like molybdotransferase Glp [Rhizomicrobium sp.]|jgi:molybdopterin molybdotransferase
MLSVDDAIRRIVAAASLIDSESVPLDQGFRRVLARDVVARVDQPPAPVSAMDGYAVRIAETTNPPVTLRVAGAAPAGHTFTGALAPGDAIRIFTGGVVPEGLDGIVIQEDADAVGDHVTLSVAGAARHIRKARTDFAKGQVLVAAGRRLSARDLALIAAGDTPTIEVRRKPRVTFVATGDELSPPGTPRGAGSIVASSGYALAPLIAQWGGEPVDLGILPDAVDALQNIVDVAAKADVIVTMGGASVGDHDLVQRALAPMGFALDFWKIAMRPGKPLIFGALRGKPFLGLPGNPVSSFVCALLFLRPLIAGLLGTELDDTRIRARLATALPANDTRQDHLRARLVRRGGEIWAEPLPIQDSSMQSALALADALLIRPPHAAAANTGDWVEALSLEGC